MTETWIEKGAAGELIDMLQRMRELALQAANDTMGTVERNDMMGEFNHLMDELERTVDAASFNGQSLLTRGGISVRGAPGNASSVLHIGMGTGTAGDGVDITIPPLTTDDMRIYRSYIDGAGGWSPTINISHPRESAPA
jgi:flagellin